MHPQSARIAALLVAPAVVALFTLSQPEGMIYTAGQILFAMWLTCLGALAMLAVDAHTARESFWTRIDVLTSSGAAMLWTAASAIVVAVLVGWASLSVVAVLGLGTCYLAVIWIALVAGSHAPWRRLAITRTLVPERAVEGDALREEIRLTDVRIPAGMRLFVTGRVMRHGPVSRYVLDARSGTDVKLEAEVGPALRGEHDAGPLELWLGDILGITRTPVMRRAEVALTVVPRTLAVEGVQQLLGAGGDAAHATPTPTLPTEGSFRIREYMEGDDTRRIHWVRSLQQDRLVVRLPDEIPPADPTVRVVLDNELAGVDQLTCRAPDDMLDALVRVWLGIAKTLADSGSRVTLVAGVPKGDTIAAVERALLARAPREGAMQLGARVTWQSTLPLFSLLDRRSERQIVVSCRPRRFKRTQHIAWVIVPEAAWTPFDLDLPRERKLTNAFPHGAAENRPARRDRELARAHARWHDRTLFSQLVCWTDWSRFSGDHVACPNRGGAALEVIP